MRVLYRAYIDGLSGSVLQYVQCHRRDAAAGDRKVDTVRLEQKGSLQNAVELQVFEITKPHLRICRKQHRYIHKPVLVVVPMENMGQRVLPSDIWVLAPRVLRVPVQQPYLLCERSASNFKRGFSIFPHSRAKLEPNFGSHPRCLVPPPPTRTGPPPVPQTRPWRTFLCCRGGARAKDRYSIPTIPSSAPL